MQCYDQLDSICMRKSLAALHDATIQGPTMYMHTVMYGSVFKIVFLTILDIEDLILLQRC
jgi:hypothetical protein